MRNNYSQLRAMWAITKGSLSAILRSPSAVIFSLAFPLIFIVVFGFIGGSGTISLKVAIDANSDTANVLYAAIKSIPGLTIVGDKNEEVLDDLEKGRITAIISIKENTNANPPYTLFLTTSQAVNPQNVQVLQSILDAIISRINTAMYPDAPTIANISSSIREIPGRKYTTIDFILPGQLGFSLLSSGVFGVAFLFFQLKQQLVLKRFFATPIRRSYIILGEALSRVIFQLTTAVVIVLIGYYVFDYTLVNGFITFLEILLLSFIALIVFMGFGFIVTGIAKNENTIPPVANIITLPQFLLAGTFFPIEAFPSWLQPLCKILPLTYFNNAMRKIAFEGAHIIDCGFEIVMMAIWGVIVYAVAVKVFKWE